MSSEIVLKTALLVKRDEGPFCCLQSELTNRPAGLYVGQATSEDEHG